MPVILLSPVYNSRTGDVYELAAKSIKAVDGFPVPAGFRTKGRVKPRLCTHLARTSKRSTRNGALLMIQRVPYLLKQHIKTKINKGKTLKVSEPIITHFNYIRQCVPSTNTGFALYMYRQIMWSIYT